jgi:hypothetical protein
MNKNLLKLAVALIIACGQNTFAQTFTITEVTDAGKSYTVASRTAGIGKKTTVSYNVDINSSLKIKINKAKINEEASPWIGNPVSIPFQRMEDLSKILAKRKELLEKINFTSADPKERKKTLNSFANTVMPLLDLVIDSMPNSPLYAKANAAFSYTNALESYTYFFDAISKEINDITEQYKAALEANKVYFRMGAFIDQTPVHMEGFDTFKDNEYYKVPRFATTINADEKKRFDDAKSFAADANKDISSAFKAKLKEAIDPILKSIQDSVMKKFSAPLDTLENALANSIALSQAIGDRISARQHDMDILERDIKALIAASKSTDGATYVSNLETNINIVVAGITRFQDSLASNLKYFETIPGIAKPVLAKFKSGYDSGKQIVKNMLNDVKTFFDDQARLNLSIPDKINESLLKLGSEVNNIQLDNIPEETEINLLTAGQRKPGDQLYIKAVISKQPATAETAIEKTIDYTHIGITQVGFYSTIKAVLLFADNTSVEFPAKKQFQLVPSYSVLFKYGTRKFNQYNRYISPGIGVNMATLDFNNDNTPEIGIGVVGSVFADYLQVGYGRNMSADQNYWFFGIRLPFIGVNLSGKTKVIAED